MRKWFHFQIQSKLIHLKFKSKIFQICFSLVIVGTMGYGPVSLASRPSPRALMQLSPKASRPRNAQSILRPGASYFGCLCTLMLPFPIDNSTKRNFQSALHDIRVSSLTNQSPCLQRNRKALPTVALSGKQLHKKKNKSSFPK